MLNGYFAGLVDLVYPRVCEVCKQSLRGIASIDKLVCARCWSKIRRNVPPFCSSCGRHLDRKNIAKNICPSCARTELHFDRAFSPCIYEGPIRDLIHNFKYKGKEHLGGALSRLLTEFIKEYRIPMEYIDTIIPIPLHAAKMREREFNQAQVLGSFIAKEFNIPLSTGVLHRHRNTRAQAEVDPRHRPDNVKKCFSADKQISIKNKNILLIDDVFTTGATSSEAARSLKESGANVVFVLALAN
ncbi:MAG: ComF family protein [Candidatus Omnitrophota bacterium]